MNKKQLIKGIEQSAECICAEQRQPYSFCKLHYVYADVDYYGVGFAKTRYPDKWNTELGALKAYRRAVADIYQQMVERAIGKAQ